MYVRTYQKERDMFPLRFLSTRPVFGCQITRAGMYSWAAKNKAGSKSVEVRILGMNTSNLSLFLMARSVASSCSNSYNVYKVLAEI